MSSKTDKRAKEILRLLLSHGRISVEELTAVFKTSPASVRRDLMRLEERGLVHRTHGGVMLAGHGHEPFGSDASFRAREQRFASEKLRIAIAAASLVQENQTIGVTAGTTTTQVARGLRLRAGVHIITNAVNIGMELSSSNHLDTTLIGGSMRLPGAFSLVGPMAIESLNVVVMDKVFLGVCGVDPARGATTMEPEEAAVFRAMSRRARQVVVVADSSKVGKASSAVICPVNEIDILITDDGVSKEAVEAFRRFQVEVMVV